MELERIAQDLKACGETAINADVIPALPFSAELLSIIYPFDAESICFGSNNIVGLIQDLETGVRKICKIPSPISACEPTDYECSKRVSDLAREYNTQKDVAIPKIEIARGKSYAIMEYHEMDFSDLRGIKNFPVDSQLRIAALLGGFLRNMFFDFEKVVLHADLSLQRNIGVINPETSQPSVVVFDWDNGSISELNTFTRKLIKDSPPLYMTMPPITRSVFLKAYSPT